MTGSLDFTRFNMMRRATTETDFDIIIIGGGATGLWLALDAATRGYRVILIEMNDFGAGTSCKSTGILHGGVRYLRQGNITLVWHAQHERDLVLENAAEFAKPMSFVVPTYSRGEQLYYRFGLTAYDALAGLRTKMARSRGLSPDEVFEALPTLERDGVYGGVEYHDGEFDDARLALGLAKTAAKYSAVVLNHTEVTKFLYRNGKVTGVEVNDTIKNEKFELTAPIVINAAGPFSDRIQKLDDPEYSASSLRPSQGVHLALPNSFFPGKSALLVPETPAKSVLFAVPKKDAVLIGTTDNKIDVVSHHPVPYAREIDYILKIAGPYLRSKPTRADVLAAFAGIRPLAGGRGKSTSDVSRDHVITISKTGLVSISGGKWTTGRLMAEQCLDAALRWFEKPHVVCITSHLQISLGRDENIRRYLAEHPNLSGKIHASRPETLAHVEEAVRDEMAMTLKDVLGGRMHVPFRDARAAIEMARPVAVHMAKIMGRSPAWVDTQVEQFTEIGKTFLAA